MKRLLFLAAFAVGAAFGHCDTLDGPVVQSARRAIASGNVNEVLAWVQPDQESAIRQAFTRTMSVRNVNPDAQKLADTWFFETVVRIHRAGEGAPYEGLKPAGGELPAALREADQALAQNDLQPLEKTLVSALQQGLRERFSRAAQTRKFETDNVSAGRKYVAAYVDFLHFAERAAKAFETPAGHEH